MEFPIEQVSLKLIDHEYSNILKNVNIKEKVFRIIHKYLIDHNYIKKNIIDLGAWIGDNGLAWAKLLPNSIIFEIDPSQENLDFINNTAKINDITNIKTINTAVSDKEEDLFTNDSLFHINCNKENGKTKLRATTLDKLNLPDIDYIHLDVEGFEWNVIKGATDLINKYKPIITYEQHLTSDRFLELSHYLKNMGYNCYLINETLQGCNIDCRNFIAFPTELNFNIRKLETEINFENLFSFI